MIFYIFFILFFCKKERLNTNLKKETQKKEFRIFLRMNTETETYEESKFVLISKCATRCRREGRKSGRKICALILTLKH